MKREKSVLFCGITVAYNSLTSLESEQISSKFTGNLEPINFQRTLKNLRTNVQTFQHIWLVTTFFKVVSLTAILAFIEKQRIW